MRNFGTKNLDDGLIGCPETSVRNYHYTLRNNPVERRSQLEVNFYDILLGEFAKLRDVTMGSIMYVCPSVRMKQLGSH